MLRKQENSNSSLVILQSFPRINRFQCATMCRTNFDNTTTPETSPRKYRCKDADNLQLMATHNNNNNNENNNRHTNRQSLDSNASMEDTGNKRRSSFGLKLFRSNSRGKRQNSNQSIKHSSACHDNYKASLLDSSSSNVYDSFSASPSTPMSNGSSDISSSSSSSGYSTETDSSESNRNSYISEEWSNMLYQIPPKKLIIVRD